MTTTWTDIRSAIVSAVLMAILAVAGYIIGIGDVFKADGHTLVNIGVISALTALTSFIKSNLIDSKGKIAGIKVK